MLYDPLVRYSKNDFRILSHDNLLAMFKEAKAAALLVEGIKLIKKVLRDIEDMRVILSGYCAIHNNEE